MDRDEPKKAVRVLGPDQTSSPSGLPLGGAVSSAAASPPAPFEASDLPPSMTATSQGGRGRLPPALNLAQSAAWSRGSSARPP